MFDDAKEFIMHVRTPMDQKFTKSFVSQIQITDINT